MMKVLVLGHTGMLGNAVHKYFLKKGVEVETLSPGTRWPSLQMEEEINNSTAANIINCIGAIPQVKPQPHHYFELNTRLPLFLFSLKSKMIIHAATDCEFSGNIDKDEFYSAGHYLDAEDLYGISKAIPAEFIKNSGSDNLKMIRASIVGIEEKTDFSLLNWFLSSVKNGKAINGYTNHYWNGITTLEWAKIAYSIISKEYQGNIFQPATEKLTKYQLLNSMAAVFSPGYAITASEHVTYHNKCLASTMEIKKIENLLQELKEFYNL